MRLENSVDIKEVFINEDLMHPNKELIAIGFRNDDSSGVIELHTKEFDKLVASVRHKTHLIKDVRVITDKHTI